MVAHTEDHLDHMVQGADSNVIVINAFISKKTCVMSPFSYSGPISMPSLVPEVREWCRTNTPGFIESPHNAANFLLRLEFKDMKDAALFRMFWL